MQRVLINLFVSVRSLGAHLRIKALLIFKMGSSNSGFVFMRLPSVSVSAEAERIGLYLTLPGYDQKVGKEAPAASSNVVNSFFFFPGL